MNRITPIATTFFLVVLHVAVCSDDPVSTADTGTRADVGILFVADVASSDLGIAPDSGIDPDIGFLVDSGVSDPNADTSITESYRVIVEAIEAERIRLGAFGVAIAIIEYGELTFAHGFGSKDPSSDDPVHATTLFCIGSVTKMLIVAMLFQFVVFGEVAFDDPITIHILEFTFAFDPNWASMITVHDLLAQTSGMFDYLMFDDSDRSDIVFESFIIGPAGLMFYLMSSVGRMYNYSNPNYYFVGLILERKSGQLYRLALRDRLFIPLGMNCTFFLSVEVLVDGDYALGQSAGALGVQTIWFDSYDNGWGWPVGYAFSSVRDLAKFYDFIVHGNDAVLPVVQRMAMIIPQVDTEELLDIVHYGYGFAIYNGVFIGNGFANLKVVLYDGALEGYSSLLWYVFEFDFGFIQLVNADGVYLSESFVIALFALNVVETSTNVSNVMPDPVTFLRFVGSYLDELNVGRVRVLTSAVGLEIDLSDLEVAGLSYECGLIVASSNNFVLLIEGFTIPLMFIFDDQGRVEYLWARLFVAQYEGF